MFLPLKAPESFDKQSITFEFSDDMTDNSDYKRFDMSAYLNRICKQTMTEGLDNQHAADFKLLASFLESKTATELVSMYDNAKSMCELARYYHCFNIVELILIL